MHNIYAIPIINNKTYLIGAECIKCKINTYWENNVNYYESITFQGCEDLKVGKKFKGNKIINIWGNKDKDKFFIEFENQFINENDDILQIK